MPLIMVRRRSVISDVQFKAVLDILPQATATALSFGVADSVTQLMPEEIEIWASDAHKFDRGTKPLEILIFAQDYPQRRKDLDLRRLKITNAVMEALLKTPNNDNTDGWVWIYLGHTDFGRLWGKKD